MNVPIRVLIIIGTRPEAIKMAPLILGMKEQPERFTPIVCNTGQHRQMLSQALSVFQIQAHYDLNVMTKNQKLYELTAKVVIRVNGLITGVKPDVVFVQGDTTTTLAAALAAFYNRVPVAHIEAGLRTWDMKNPFPEEANRVLVDRLSAYCFAPTEQNRKNLLCEGIHPDHIFVTGNTAIDALLKICDKIQGANPEIWNQHWGTAQEAILDSERPLILVTVHRRESFGTGLRSIYAAIKKLAQSHPDWAFVYPVHLNPNVQTSSKKILSDIGNIYLIEPLDYEPFVFLMKRAHVILTDSGGIQEEAPSLGKPVIVVREKTERQEAVDAGTAILAGTDKESIKKEVEHLMGNPALYQEISSRPNPYGDGFASKRILDYIWQKLAKL